MDEPSFQPNPEYLHAQLQLALETARSHEVPEARDRALGRIEKITKVALGIARGTLDVGSRQPVRGLPVWVTPEVIRGGFATGEPAAGGPLTESERALASTLGAAADRGTLFAALLEPSGLAAMRDMLETGAFHVKHPEHAALLVVAWLAGEGRPDAAAQLVETIAPFASAVQFAPQPRTPDRRPHGVVSRRLVEDTKTALAARQENPRVASMRESLEIWIPFADELLALWLATARDGEVDAHRPKGWQQEAAAAVVRFEELAAVHRRVTRTHSNPKENLARLLIATREAVRGELAPATRGRLQHAVDAMVRKRGVPGSPPHRALRTWQAEIAARPGHHELAAAVGRRLEAFDEDRGVPDPEAVLGPITETEAATAGLRAGQAIPAAARRIVRRAQEGTPEALLEAGIIGSAEVLAELSPEITAPAVAASYSDPALRRVIEANYRAFRRRRSLLLWNLENQVTVDELPWIEAVRDDRSGTGGADTARVALDRMAALTVTGFPGTLIPSPMIEELETLAYSAGLRLPLLEELAADIFMGRFSEKFLDAAQIAGRLLADSLYSRYYGIDYAAIAQMASAPLPATPTHEFDKLCIRRSASHAHGGPSGMFGRGSTAGNGSIIEQAQILTTQNLAALTAPEPDGLGLTFDLADLAVRSFDRSARFVAQIPEDPRPLGAIKNAAYAWRNMVFFLALLPAEEQVALVAGLGHRSTALPPHAQRRLAPALAGLRLVAEGDAFDEHDGAVLGSAARRFTGWTVGPHWMVADPGDATEPALPDAG